MSTLTGYDVLAVPSRWMENAPLVVLEAFAAGIPIIGSDLGGIAELVTHGVDGLLLPVDDLAAWTATLRRLAADREEMRRLAAGVRPPRTMAQVAADMVPIYASALTPARRP